MPLCTKFEGDTVKVPPPGVGARKVLVLCWFCIRWWRASLISSHVRGPNSGSEANAELLGYFAEAAASGAESDELGVSFGGIHK